MLKKVGLATLALAGLMSFASPKADAAVRFRIGVGVPPYSYPYAYPYGYPYGYPYPAYGPYTYSYPNAGPSIGLGFDLAMAATAMAATATAAMAAG